MGMRTELMIEAWQKAAGITPATGECAEVLDRLSKACFEAIKIIELEKSGIRDGDGLWHGSDVIGGMARDLTDLCERLIGKFEKRQYSDLNDEIPFPY